MRSLLLVFCLWAVLGACVDSQLTDLVDDCCCNVDTVLRSNEDDVNPLLNKIASSSFFKYFKTDLYSECPLWVTNAQCVNEGCAICEANQDEVPQFWTSYKTDLVETTTPPNFVSWSDKPEDMWTLLGKEEEMAYVNMNMYPESNTGYGTSPNDAGVWQRIYKENCFTGPLNQACLEERVLFRLVSALHTSINTHVAYNYDRVLDNNNHTKAWKHNIDLYKRLVGNWPDRVKNLYFGYLFLLRAANKARPFLEQYRYNTGHPQEDEQVKQLMKKMLSAPLLCSPNFDESTLFTGPEKEQQKLKFKNHFRNISQIINCVTCEKCKTWAKLQLLGIGTALKILVDYDTDVVLERNEVIALVNTLRQFSDSITWIRVMSEQHDDKQISSTLDLLLSLARSFFSSPYGLVAVLPVVLVYVLRRQQTNKKATTTTTTTTTATTKTAKTTKTTNDGEHKKKT